MRTFFLFMGFVVPAILLLMTDASPSVDTTPVLTSENQWDSDACGTGLTLSKGLIAEYTGNNTGFCTVFAKEAIPNRESGIFYFEVKISPRTDENGEIVDPSESGYVSIGLATKEMPLDEAVGLPKGTYGYEDTGGITGLGVHESFDDNDVVGCGVNLKNRQVFFTKNKELIATTKLSDNVTVDQLFPCVSMYHTGSKIKANFGLIKGFKFDIKNGFRK